VPSLEHNGKVAGESLDLIKYIDDNFQGPALLPQVRSESMYTTCIHLQEENAVDSVNVLVF
jgi:hypothetical protein